jgi:hypothetical protein
MMPDEDYVLPAEQADIERIQAEAAAEREEEDA